MKKYNGNSKINLSPNVTVYIAIFISLVFCTYNYYLLRKSRVACIDTAKVLQAYKGIEDLRKSYDGKTKLFKARLDTLKLEFENSLKFYEKNRPNFTEKQVKEEEAKLRKKQDEYSRYSLSNEESLKNEETKIIEKAIETVNAKIKRFAKTKGYSVVLASTPNGGLVYVSDYFDITNEIIEIINN